MAGTWLDPDGRVRSALQRWKERLCGVDLFPPEKARKRQGGADSHVSEEMLRTIFSHVDTRRFPRLLDIDCGRGYVLWKAREAGFATVGGLEADKKLFRVCVRNMRRLGLAGQIAVTNADACSFAGYGEYDVFYFFGEAAGGGMRTAIDCILEQCRGREIMLVYYHPRRADRIEECGCFTKTATLYDAERDYLIYLYHGIIPESEDGCALREAWRRETEKRG